tara:strand:+ start:8568 stop:8996 length:429 start_codon:yes stop_codon:yes gene_type:complete
MMQQQANTAETNILQFPKKKRVTPPETPDEQLEAIHRMRHAYVEEVVYACAASLTKTLAIAGVNVADPIFRHDNVLVLEGLISAISRQQRVHHPIQDLMDRGELLPMITRQMEGQPSGQEISEQLDLFVDDIDDEDEGDLDE